MVVVKTARDFFVKNHKELKAFAVYKTGISDADVINDLVQDFYVRMITSKTLDTFDPNQEDHESVKCLFESYICYLFCWQLPYRKKKNYRVHLRAYSVCKKDSKIGKQEYDIYDHVGSDADIKVDPVYDAAIVTDEKEKHLDWYIERFKEYILKTESPKEAHRLVTLLESRYEGCNSRDVAVMLGVSDNMAKIHKQKLHKKFKEWTRDQIDL
jgi:DNA-directed RNA polymerase specialized sigma24 family protein